MDDRKAAPQRVTIQRMVDSYRGPGHDPGWSTSPGDYEYCKPRPTTESHDSYDD